MIACNSPKKNTFFMCTFCKTHKSAREKNKKYNIKEKSKMIQKLTKMKKLTQERALFEGSGEHGQWPALPKVSKCFLFSFFKNCRSSDEKSNIRKAGTGVPNSLRFL